MLFRDMKMTINEAMAVMDRKALFSECKRYRFRLIRRWSDGKSILFIMLNPSIADENREDPTVRRCIGFAHQWGYGSLEVRNIFSLVSTDPRQLYDSNDPIGPMDILYPGDDFDKVIVAWGNHGSYMGRGKEVIRYLLDNKIDVYHFGLTKMGEPKHPLYLKSDIKMIRIEDVR